MLKVNGAELGKCVPLTGYALVKRAGGWVVLDENDKVAWKLDRRQVYLIERLVKRLADKSDEVRLLVDEESVILVWNDARLYLYKGGHFAGGLVDALRPKSLLGRVLFALNL